MQYGCPRKVPLWPLDPYLLIYLPTQDVCPLVPWWLLEPLFLDVFANIALLIWLA